MKVKTEFDTARVTFHCDCKGETKLISPGLVMQACNNKYSPCTSYYDGVDRFVYYERIQINPELTGGAIQYNWWVKREG